MNICLVTDRPHHPVLSAVMAGVAARHRVRILDTADLLSASVEIEAELRQPADVYLLRSHVPAAIALTRQLELAGALVVNRCSATAACGDRVLLAAQARSARLPWPRTESATDPASVIAKAESPLSFPVVAKSRWSRRDDLVSMVDSPDELARVLAARPGEPVVIQAYVANDGIDRKLYVVDGQVLGLCSPSPLSGGNGQARTAISVPPHLARLALRVGHAFGLRVYGVDLVLGAAGPVIVDVNPFPGFRGVPGARETLIGLVDRLATESRGDGVGRRGRHDWLRQLPAVSIEVARRGRLPVGTMDKSPAPAIRSVRLKPGRGLTVSLVAPAARSPSGGPLLTVTVAQENMEGARLGSGLPEVERMTLETPAPGTAHVPKLSLSVQVFPADAALPTLAACLDVRSGSPLHSTLQAAGRVQLKDGGWTADMIRADALRYKIGSRCVIAYHLQAAGRQGITIIGKVYADRARAGLIHDRLERLHRHLAPDATFVPRPLGVVGSLGLSLTEAIVSAPEGSHGVRAWPRPLAPTWRPRFEHVGGTNIAEADRMAARLSGAALARLHAWNPELREWDFRDGRREATAVQQRVVRLMAWQPPIKTQLQRLGDELAGRLRASVPDHLVVAHGGFKRSQLIHAVDRVFVIDFDGMCAADPALDVGCFLAYLRPSRMYYGRRGYREWFQAAAAHFVAAYRNATLTNGGRPDRVADILERARLYEASHLFKIATRRASRLSSPRPRELSSICEEIAGCLADPRGWS